ncbi:MAG: hypothetical protein M3O41_19760 [Pseudomonadota bacterium]|nr:hypothetical protein [Pseudomonadota bacterium]
MRSVAGQTIVRLKDFRAEDLANRVSDAVGSLADQLASGVQSWTSKARNLGATTDGLVRASPWRAAGTIALVGVAAGILVSHGARRARLRSADGGRRDSTSRNSTSEVLGG